MRYIGRRASETNPLRSIPLLRSVAATRHPASVAAPQPIVIDPDWTPYAPLVLSDRQQAERNLANAEAALREAIRCYDAARRGIGEANATRSRDLIDCGRVIMHGTVYTPERIRARKSAAFRLFNQRRRELNRDRRWVDEARAALGLPLLIETEEREVRAKVVRTSKRRPVTPIAQASLPV